MTENKPRITYMPVLRQNKPYNHFFDLRKEGVLAVTMAVPMELLAVHEHQAQRNHGQSLNMLASRGGLSPCEMLAVLENRPWAAMPDALAEKKLTTILSMRGCLNDGI